VGVKGVAEFALQESHGREYPLVFHTSDDMDQCDFCKLQIFWKTMCKDPRGKYGPPYSSDGVEVVRRFHGSRGVTLHCNLEIPLLRIQGPSVKDARYDLLVNPTSQHLGIAIPIFQNVKVL
jgi:hypothetical protein